MFSVLLLISSEHLSISAKATNQYLVAVRFGSQKAACILSPLQRCLKFSVKFPRQQIPLL